MSARNPGPYMQQVPIGFPSYCRKMNKDGDARKAFMNSEINGRVYKCIYENLGVKGRIVENRHVGRNRINLRDIHNGYARGNFRWEGDRFQLVYIGTCWWCAPAAEFMTNIKCALIDVIRQRSKDHGR